MAGLDDGFERALLQELLSAYGPCGQEDQVREICRGSWSTSSTNFRPMPPVTPSP